MNASKLTTFAVHCPHCGHNTPQTIAWLTVHNDMPCAECGGVVNLESGDVAFAIQKLAEQCRSIDAAARKSR